MLIGIIGKPNVGKSTFFKSATLADVEIANYPFTTIEANEGVGFVRVKCPEQENKKCKPKHGFCIKGQRFVPVKLIDVAGLVPGAHKGKGKGNQFLDDLREADCLIHILDISGRTDSEGNQTEGYDITEDVRFLENEIDMWIFGILENNWKTLARKVQTAGGKLSSEIARQLSGLKIKEDDINSIMKKLMLSDRGEAWKPEHLVEFAREIRKESKPIIIAANKSDRPESQDNLDKLKEEFPETLIIPCSAESELALKEAAKDDLIEYIPGDNKFEIKQENKISEQQKKALDFIDKKILKVYDSTGIQNCLNKSVFDFLKFISVYPVENANHMSDSKGNILPDAFLLPPNSTALDLAFAVHTDIGEKFIGAIDAKTKQKIGKEHILKNGDILQILTK